MGFLCSVSLTVYWSFSILTDPQKSDYLICLALGWPKLQWFVTANLNRHPKDWQPPSNLDRSSPAYIEVCDHCFSDMQMCNNNGFVKLSTEELKRNTEKPKLGKYEQNWKRLIWIIAFGKRLDFFNFNPFYICSEIILACCVVVILPNRVYHFGNKVKGSSLKQNINR